MRVRIGRTLPPAAAPVTLRDLCNGLNGLRKGKEAIEHFRRSLCRHFGVRHCFLLSSGTAALTVTLKALQQLSPHREQVLIPAFTCFSVPSAIKRAGLSICLCDLEPDGLDFDPDALARMIAQRGKHLLAVIPTHLYGIPADISRIRRGIGSEAVAIIEDAAQAMGALGPDGFLGVQGDCGILSLGRGKPLSTGEGGIILTSKDDLAQAIAGQVRTLPGYSVFQSVRLLLATLAVSLLSRPALFWFPKALPFLRLGETIYDTRFAMRRLSAFQAGVALRWIEKLAAFQNARRSNAHRWRVLCLRLGMDDGMVDRARPEDLVRYPLSIADRGVRRKILTASAQQGLGIMPGYPSAITAIPALKDELAAFVVPRAERVAESLLTLPTHPMVARPDRNRISRLLAQVSGTGAVSTAPQALPIARPSKKA